MKKLFYFSFLLVISHPVCFAQETVVRKLQPDNPARVEVVQEPSTTSLRHLALPYTEGIRVSDIGLADSPAGAFGNYSTVFMTGMNFSGELFPPIVIMHNQDKLDLTEKQVEDIKTELKAFQSSVVDVQWNVQAASQKLNEQLEVEKINERQAMTIMKDLLKHENDLKSSHLRMLIRIRNMLTEQQIKKLRELTQAHIVSFPPGTPAPPNAVFFKNIQHF